MRVDYLGLEAFVAVAELGSFAAAAAHLSLSQTALSHRMRKLEADLGVQLFVRSSRDVTLTRDGQDLLPSVRADLATLKQAYAAVSGRGKAQAEEVSFACLPTLAYNYLPQIIGAFTDARPDLTIRIEDCQAGRVYDKVRAGEVGFGISIVGTGQVDLDIETLYSEPYMLYLHRDHPLAERDSVSLADLEGLVFAQIITQSRSRVLVDDSLGPSLAGMQRRFVVQTGAMALSLVGQGIAATILPKLMGQLGWPQVRAVPFADVSMERTLGIVTRRGTALPKSSRALIAAIKARLAQDG